MNALTGTALDTHLDEVFGEETRPEFIHQSREAMARLIGGVSVYALTSPGLSDAERLASIAGLIVSFAASPEGAHLHLLDDVKAGAR